MTMVPENEVGLDSFAMVSMFSGVLCLALAGLQLVIQMLNPIVFLFTFIMMVLVVPIFLGSLDSKKI